MLLAIDAGNSNTVFALYDGRKQLAKWRTATDLAWGADAQGLWLQRLMAGQGWDIEPVSGAVVGSVVEGLTGALVQLCRDRCGVDPVLAEAVWPRCGLPIRVEQPDRVGIDRAANAVAAHAHYEGAVLVVDFGTATKFDVVAADGGFEGGAICPGFVTSMEALHRSVARVPSVAYARPFGIVGRTTEAAVQVGASWGYSALVEGLIGRIEREYGEAMTVVATGGLAPLFAPFVPAIDHHETDLTLDGLVLLYEGGRE
jgi:type III pantothenate kinase